MTNVLPKYQGMTVEEVKAAVKRFPFSVAMYNPSYGINMGAVLRSCNAFGATEFIRVGKRKFDRRAAQGVQNYETIQHFQTWDASLKWMRARNYTIVGVDWIDGYSRAIHDIPYYPGHTVFILGSERNGLPQSVVSACDEVVHIEQFGTIPSLNVAQAATVIMYDWHEKRRNGVQ
jgi:tRNA G18 (ribose-2'-O)-methylase SpoU